MTRKERVSGPLEISRHEPHLPILLYKARTQCAIGNRSFTYACYSSFDLSSRLPCRIAPHRTAGGSCRWFDPGTEDDLVQMKNPAIDHSDVAQPPRTSSGTISFCQVPNRGQGE